MFLLCVTWMRRRMSCAGRFALEIVDGDHGGTVSDNYTYIINNLFDVIKHKRRRK